MSSKQTEYDDYSSAVLPEGLEPVHPYYAISWHNNRLLRQEDFVVTYITPSRGGTALYVAEVKRQGKSVVSLAPNT